MGFFKEIKKAISSVAKATKVDSLLGGLFGSPTPSGSYDDLGGTAATAATASVAQSDEAMQSAKTKKTNDAKQRRQGFSGGSTLLTTTEDETQQLNKNTLLGM